jgi:TP901 family phage tail tape measure protein
MDTEELALKFVAFDAISDVAKQIGENLMGLLDRGNAVTKGLVMGFSVVAVAAVAVAAAEIGVVVATTKMASEFQNSTVVMMNNAGITAAAAKSIGDAFLATAGTTVFSAQQIMDAFGGVAGQFRLLYGHALNAADSLTLMAAASDLAEATTMDLTTTTATLTNVLVAYKLPVSEAATVTDELFNSARAVNLPLSDFTAGILKLNARLGDIAPSFRDASALMIEMAQNGITGNRGMMILNTGLTTLLGGSKATTAELRTLGVNVFDSAGNFVGLRSVIEQLAPKMAGLSEEQRRLAEAALFGKGAEGVLNDILLRGTVGFDAATAAVANHGTAQAAAAAQLQTFDGQMRLLDASVRDAGISLGQKFLPYAVLLLQWIIPMVPRLAAFAQTVIGDTVPAIQAIAVWIGKLLPPIEQWALLMWNQVSPALQDLMKRSSDWLPVLEAIGMLVGLVIIVVANLVVGLIRLADWMAKLYDEQLVPLRNGFIDLANNALVMAAKGIESLVGWFQRLGTLIGAVGQLLADFSRNDFGALAGDAAKVAAAFNAMGGATAAAAPGVPYTQFGAPDTPPPGERVVTGPVTGGGPPTYAGGTAQSGRIDTTHLRLTIDGNLASMLTNAQLTRLNSL